MTTARLATIQLAVLTTQGLSAVEREAGERGARDGDRGIQWPEVRAGPQGSPGRGRLAV